MKIKVLLGLIVGYFCVCGYLEAAENLDLVQSYQLAVERDAAYLAAGFQVKAAKESEGQALAALLPSLSFDAQTTRVDVTHETAGGELNRKGRSENYGLQFSQPVFNWKSWVTYRRGSKQKALGMLKYEVASQELKLNVAQSYFNAVAAMDVLESLESLSSTLQEQLKRATVNFEIGNGSVVEVHEAQASLDANRANIVQARSDVSIARVSLAKFTGGYPHKLSRMLDSAPELQLPEESLGELIQASQAFNLRIQEYELLRDIAENNKDIAFSDHLPALDLVASHTMQQNPSAGTNQSDSNVIGLRFSMPLYSGGRASSSQRQAEALYQQSDLELLDIRRQVSVEVNEAWSGVEDGIALIRALQAARKSAASSVESNQLGYRLGARMGVDVLDAQSRLSDVIQQLAKAKYDTLMAHLRLRSAVGALTEGDLIAINDYLRAD
ncbi:outer membrane protein [Pseudomonas cuatrocienegasensis]|uniref:Outer membrane protein n=1 Tax=Pseudomonas cuatrocienegasensis TaxID=543360 RepID=A0ABY1B5S2_9PSED|nr:MULTISPECIES: TolC family outer membrane protein [Pseudomonas]OEC37447.1 hypothetical protein A7D25_01930 [Pseudomonas sp. 21C1]SEP97128.1 outer membrane protein [Pseudomonas cuatrocienegasensis]